MSNVLRGTVVNPKTIYGKSAYEIAVEHGFNGTEEEWLKYVEANGAEWEEKLKAVRDSLSNVENDLTVNVKPEVAQLRTDLDAHIGKKYVRREIKVTNDHDVIYSDNPNRLPFFFISKMVIKAPDTYWGDATQVKVKSIRFSAMDEDLNGKDIICTVPDSVYNHPLYGWVVRDNINAFILIGNEVDFETGRIGCFSVDDRNMGYDYYPMGIVYLDDFSDVDVVGLDPCQFFFRLYGSEGAQIVKVHSSGLEYPLDAQYDWVDSGVLFTASWDSDVTEQKLEEQAAKGDPCYAILQVDRGFGFGTEQIKGLETPPILALTPSETGGIFTITAFDENGNTITRINPTDADPLVVELTLVVYEKE